MPSLREELMRRQAENKPIRIGASATGWMGSGFITQANRMPGLTVSLVANSDVAAAREALVSAGVPPDQIVAAAGDRDAETALREGKRVVTADYTLASRLALVDIVADVTPSPAIGAETAWACIRNRKDIVMVNIEADVTVGRILSRLAKEAGVLYTVSSGDEPGCLMELYDFVTTLGFEPIAMGKGKNNPLDRTATPDSVAASARKAGKDPYQVASYVDGTKTMFEMACASNATGFPPMVRGMAGPEANRQNISKIFALVEDGGITRFPGVVDFVQGNDMSGGVFLTVRISHERIRQDLEYLKVGKGNYFTFFRPYHLWFLEAPISIARAFLRRETTLVPKEYPVADVMTVAKRALRPAPAGKPCERLDQFGGYTFYGIIEAAATAAELRALPAGLAPGAEIVRSVAAGNVVTWDDVRLDEAESVVRLRRLQDKLPATGPR